LPYARSLISAHSAQASPFLKPETEVKASLKALYGAVFSERTDQLVVKQASEDI